MSEMSECFKEKFIAFIDVLGFKDMIAAAERGTGRTLPEIDEILCDLENPKHKAFLKEHGPQTCPKSIYIQKDLDFEVTQVSDCAIISAEISPAGVINLLNHCWGAAIMLLSKGVMVRGYVTRGTIHHHGAKFRGTGYHTAYAKESNVSAFKKEADEKGTPFIEIDSNVLEYIDQETDNCVREMFKRYVKYESGVAAIFPFQLIHHSFIVSGGGEKFDPNREKINNDNVRQAIKKFKNNVLKYVDSENEKAMRKLRHYIDALDEQLKVCDKTDKMIDMISMKHL